MSEFVTEPTTNERKIQTILKTVAHKLAHIITLYGAVAIVAFLFGTSFGYKLATHLYKQKMDEAVKVGGLVYEGKVYDLKERLVVK